MENETRKLECSICSSKENIKYYNSNPLCELHYLTDKREKFLLDKKSIIISPEIVQITDKIFVGNSNGAKDKNKLKELEITHILIIGAYLYEYFPEELIYKTILCEDSENEDISIFFTEAFDFIDSSSKILIHCYAGVSRSPSVVIAYLMWKKKKNYSQVYSFVKNKRKTTSPNNGFKRTLINFDIYLKKYNYTIPSGIQINNELLENFI